MRLVYVSGPYRAPTVSGIVDNIRKAENMAVQVWGAGAACICPHLNTALLDGRCPDEVWLAGDIEMLKRCDAVLMIDGWLRSEGAQAERLVAIEANIPVFYSMAELRWWIENGGRDGQTVVRPDTGQGD